MKIYILSVGIIFLALAFSYFVGLITTNLIQKFMTDNSSNIDFPIVPIGYGTISLLSNYLYFNLNLSSKLILLLIFTLSVLLIIIFPSFFKLKKIRFSEIISVFFISSIFILFILFKGEQFYIFRGNHWDSINYLSTALTIKDFDYREIFELREANTYPKESYIYTGDIIYRPLVKLILSFFLHFQLENYFFQYWIFKIFLICNIFISCQFFLKNIGIKNSKVYTYIFIFSSWFLYIIEIDAISHLSAYSFFILGISLVINKNSNQIFFNKNYEILFLFSSILVLLFYPEIFLVFSYIIIIFLFFKLGIKKTFSEIFKKRIKTILFFLILTIPTYQLTYKVIYLNIGGGIINSNVDWWGYYGAFLLGKIDNFIILDEVGRLKDLVFINGLNLDTFKQILFFSDSQIYHHLYLNIIPSFFGLYYLTNLNINSYLNLIFVILLNIFLIKIIYLNFIDFLKNKNLRNTFIISVVFSFFSMCIFFIILNLNFWLIVKIYTYLSFFIYLFVINNINFFKKKIYNLYLSRVLILLLIIFPIYKYYPSNNGIGKLDNFPSILNFKLKNEINWEIDNTKIRDCSSIYFDNPSGVILNYLSVKLKFEGFIHINQTTFKNVNKLNNIRNCELAIEKHSFIVKKVY